MQAAVWSASTNGPVSGEIIYAPLADASQLDAIKGTLKGMILLLGAPRPLPDLNQPLSFRYSEDELKELQGPGAPRRPTGPPPANAASRIGRRRVAVLRQRAVQMAEEEGSVAILLPSHEEGRNIDTGLLLNDNGVELADNAQLRENAVPIPYTVVMTEHYNRLARLAQAHVPVMIEVNIQAGFTGDHEHGFNTIAEIAGTDPALKDQVVMVGGHLDNWAAGTGATDNGAGAVIAMEAVRILRTLDVKPKRTIRIALWRGEEQGEFGSRGVCSTAPPSVELCCQPRCRRHIDDRGNSHFAHPGKGLGSAGCVLQYRRGRWQSPRDLHAGQLRVAPIFEQWIAPLKDLGVTTVINRIDVGSDHESFDDAGLPGFEFLQDELDYETRTHHSSLDTVDHLYEADLEQAAIVEAIFLWNTSQREAMMPRKPFPHPENEKMMNAPIPVSSLVRR